MVTKEIPPPGYNILLHPCMDGRSRGGLGIYTKTTLPLVLTKVLRTTTLWNM